MVSQQKRDRVVDILHELTHPVSPGENPNGVKRRNEFKKVFDAAELNSLRDLINAGDLPITGLPSPVAVDNLIELGLVAAVRRTRRGLLGEAVSLTHFHLTRRGVIVSQFLHSRQ